MDLRICFLLAFVTIECYALLSTSHQKTVSFISVFGIKGKAGKDLTKIQDLEAPTEGLLDVRCREAARKNNYAFYNRAGNECWGGYADSGKPNVLRFEQNDNWHSGVATDDRIACRHRLDFKEHGYNDRYWCTEVGILAKVGWSFNSNTREYDFGMPNVVCPKYVDKNNWLGFDQVDDTFSIVHEGTKIKVTRTDKQEGWTFQLQFGCEIKNTYGDPIRKRWCKNHIDMENICDGDFNNCFNEGIAKCNVMGKGCYGVMAHDSWWTGNHRGVKLCTSPQLEDKSKQDWITKLKNVETNVGAMDSSFGDDFIGYAGVLFLCIGAFFTGRYIAQKN